MILMIDWGIGGLSVYRKLKAIRPDAGYAYISDAGFTPYGRVPAPELADRLAQLIESSRKVWEIDRVIIACNAASTVLPLLKIDGCPVTGVIEPAIAMVAASGFKKIGVIGGIRTIESRTFSSRLEPLGFEVKEVVAQPLSALIERGILGGPELDDCLNPILAPLTGVDALVLACTHYPAVEAEIAKRLPGTVILDPDVSRTGLPACHPEPKTGREACPTDLFFTTGDISQTQRSAKLAFGIDCEVRPLPF